MAGYIRRFLTDPGEEVLLEIESVNILDLEPPASITGVGTGTACIVGEFENGPFAAVEGTSMWDPKKGVFEVSSATDLVTNFGELGYTYGGVPGQNPSARTRSVDAAVLGELWNGNGFVNLSGKKFRRLIIARVDTSVGSVEFSRIPYQKGLASPTFNLEPGQHLDFSINGGGAVVATFNATAGTITGAAAAFGTIVAGDTVILGYDAAPDFTVTFLAGDTTVGAVIARINQYAGFTFATNAAGQVALTGRQRGTGGQVRVVTGGTATAKIGHVVAVTPGTGNVANIDAVTDAEAHAVVNAASATTSVVRDSDGRIRLSDSTTPLTGTLSVAVTTTATAFGFTTGVTNNAASGNAGVIPAGTRVRVAAGQRFVTMQDIPVTAANAGPYSVKVRHATDDGTGLSALVATITSVESPILLDQFAVTNPLPTVAALSEAQIDVKYQEAIDASRSLNDVGREINLIWSARQSNVIRRALRENARDASATGCFGRMAAIRPPLRTTRAVAQSTSVEPGVGPYRDQRVIYNFPGVRTIVPKIAAVGSTGGTGFNATGVAEVGSDGFVCSVLSQLAPEENPGQLTTFTGAVIGLESASDVANLNMVDYTNFRKSGICAPRMDDGTAVFQSGVTSVDPTVQPNLRNIARRRMADFIQDTLARRGKAFSKKLSTRKRRDAMVGEIRTFLISLLSPSNPDAQRIAGFTIDIKANTLDSLGKGIYRIIINVRTVASLDSIVLQTTVGEQVTVEELAA